MWRLKSFFLRVRHSFVPLLCGLLLLFSADCGLSTSDLRWSHPSTPIYAICDTPLDVPNGITLWGFNYTTKQLVTAEDPAELRGFYGVDAFFELDYDAPESSVLKMPSEYGLTCRKRASSFPDASALFLTPSSALFRSKEPCSAKVAETVGRADPNLFAVPAQAKAPCDPPKKVQKRLHVCVRSEGVPWNALEWTNGGMVKGNLWIFSGPEYAEAAKTADRIYVFDDKASPESVWHFGKDTKLRCPGRAPIPYDQAIALGWLQGMDTATDRAAALKAAESKKGDGKTTDTSSEDGKGPPLDFLETLVHNVSIVGALASGDTSGNLKDPNGSRYGIPGGKNVGGPNLLILQAAAGTFAILGNPLKSGKDFIAKIIRARTEGKVVIILNPKVLTKEMAEELAKDTTAADGTTLITGKVMAESLQKAGVIMPYSRAEIFTKGWLRDFQAHHIFEVHVMEDLGIAGAKDAPAVILTAPEHLKITNKLRAAYKELKRTAGENGPSKAQVWEMYKQIYTDPNWLKAIEHYFQ